MKSGIKTVAVVLAAPFLLISTYASPAHLLEDRGTDHRDAARLCKPKPGPHQASTPDSATAHPYAWITLAPEAEDKLGEIPSEVYEEELVEGFPLTVKRYCLSNTELHFPQRGGGEITISVTNAPTYISTI